MMQSSNANTEVSVNWQRGPCRARFASIACVLVCVFFTGCDKESQDDREAQHEVGNIWGSLLTQCGESYFYTGSVFEKSKSNSAPENPKSILMEYRKPSFNLVPVKISDAERLNGLTYHGRLSMVAGVYRDKGGPWNDGPASEARNTEDVLAQALQGVGSDLTFLGAFGVMTFELVKLKALYKERWETFIANAGVVFGFAPNDLTTAEWMSKRSGQTTVVAKGISQNAGTSTGGQVSVSAGDGASDQQIGRPLFLPHELIGFEEGMGLLWLAGMGNSTKFFAPPYWKIKECRERAAPNPYYEAEA